MTIAPFLHMPTWGHGSKISGCMWHGNCSRKHYGGLQIISKYSRPR